MDPEIAAIIKDEKSRQIHGLELIASENFTSRAVGVNCCSACCRTRIHQGETRLKYFGSSCACFLSLAYERSWVAQDGVMVLVTLSWCW